MAQVPAKTGGSKSLTGLKGKQKRFITILQDDFNFDIIERIVKHIKVIERSKKIRPPEKHRMLQNYYMTLLTYCVPKMKLIEDNTSKLGDKIAFNINIQNNDTSQSQPVKSGPGGGVNITIPTVKGKNGAYDVDVKN